MHTGTALLAVALVVAPGIGVSFAVFPGRGMRLAVRSASVVAFGYATVALIAFALAVFGTLTETWFLSVYVAAGLGVGMAAAQRHSWRLVGRPRLKTPPTPDWESIVGVAGLIAYATYHWSLSPYLNLGVSTPFRYWADGLEIAQAHGIPKDTLQWGALYPATVSKVGFNSFNAAESVMLGATPLQAMAALAWLGGVGVYLALWATADELGLGWAAPLLPVLLLAAPSSWPLSKALTQDALMFRAEDFGRLVALSAFALAVRCLRTRARRLEFVAVGILFGLAAFVHLIPVIVAAAMLIPYAIAIRWSRFRVKATAMKVAAMGAAAFLTYAAVLLGSHGDLGLQGAQSSATYTKFQGVDPTVLYRTGQRVPIGSGSAALSAPHLIDDFIARAFRIGPGISVAVYCALGVLAVVALASTLLWERRLVQVVVVAIGLALTLVITAMWFAHHYSLMIQATFGERRLFDYSALSVTLLILVMAEIGLIRAACVHRALAAGLVAVAVAIVLVSAVTQALAAPGRSADAASHVNDTLAVYNLISREVPCNARILPNFKSEGVVEALTGRRSMLEGMSPYLRPSMLIRVLSVIHEAKAFFRRPVARHSLLHDWRIDYVMTVPQHMWIGQFGRAWKIRAVSKVPELRLVGVASGVALYRVEGSPHANADGAALPRTCSVALRGGS